MEKPPAVACHHLTDGGRCSVFGARTDHGMAGCNHYSCHGAGQYVTQHLFAGESWQDTPALLAPMVDAFLEMARLQMVLATVTLALERGLPANVASALRVLSDDLVPAEGWTLDALHSGPSVAFERRLNDTLSQLKDTNTTVL